MSIFRNENLRIDCGHGKLEKLLIVIKLLQSTTTLPALAVMFAVC